MDDFPGLEQLQFPSRRERLGLYVLGKLNQAYLRMGTDPLALSEERTRALGTIAGAAIGSVALVAGGGGGGLGGGARQAAERLRRGCRSGAYRDESAWVSVARPGSYRCPLAMSGIVCAKPARRQA
jgi:hypothetical protein